ncbi:MAG: FAD:protein FMN transferase [Acidimicrobiales bacterium]|nr:FAD:protein FMN transferase [Acidimicrobiales bacterium]
MVQPAPPSTRFGTAGLVAHELHFRAMGTDAQIVVVGAEADLAIWASDRVAALEAAWTRFAPSELGALAERPDVDVPVSDEVFRLVEASCTAWRATDGAFDPTVLAAVAALGYDRTFDEVVDRDSPAAPDDPTEVPGLGGVVLDPAQRTVRLPTGVAIDPGGIGKGLAADLVTDEVVARGAAGVLVNLGGDCRVAGASPDESGWTFGVEDPFAPDDDLAVLSVSDGGVATSSTRRRRWRRGGEEVHHLIDPATGRPTASGVRSATVVAGAAWWAEAEAKMLVVSGVAGLGRLREASAIVVGDDGSVHATDDLADAVRDA